MFLSPGRPRRYRQVADYCAQVVAEGGSVPSYNQIATALGIYDRGTVRRYVVQAEEAGLLSRSGPISGGKRSDSRRIRLGHADEADRKRIRPGDRLN